MAYIKNNILYRDGKWADTFNLPKYEQLRNNIKKSFEGLEFVAEGHKYFLNGKQMTCVSDVTHLFKEHFDSKQKSIETFERNYNNPYSQYYRMTADEILKQWKSISKEACEAGTFTHECGESLFYYMTGQNTKVLVEFQDRLTDDGGFRLLYPKEIAAAKFWVDVPDCFIPILAETKVFDDELNFSGTYDIMFYCDTTLGTDLDVKHGIVIFDYKTNKNLEKNFAQKKLLAPFDYMLDMPKSLYTLQLSLYQSCLEKKEFNVVNRILLWLKPDEQYEQIELPDVVTELREALKDKELVPSIHD